jgi:putative transcriptional regulator
MVAKWRREKDVSKAQMARRIGVERSYMTKLEQQRLQPSAEMMFRIAKYLGQPLESLFQYEQSSNSSAIFCPKRCLTGKNISNPCPAADREQRIMPETRK